jgi:hypothetical protein
MYHSFPGVALAAEPGALRNAAKQRGPTLGDMSGSGMVQRSSLLSFSIGLGLLIDGGLANAAPSDTPTLGASLASTTLAEGPDDEPPRYAPPAPDPSRFQLGLGTGLMLGLGDVWEQEGDVSGSAGGPIFVDLSLAPSYRVARELALGIRAGVGLEPGARGVTSSSGEPVSLDRKLWHASATGRYQPRPGRGWYLTLSAGAAEIVDSEGDASVSQWAPLLGAAAGYDVPLVQLLSLGLELRAAYAPFGKGSRTAADRRYDYDVSTWIGAGVVLDVLP